MGVKMLVLWILLACAVMQAQAGIKNMNIKYQWKYIDYDFPSEEARQAAISSGRYNLSNIYLVDADEDRARDRTFVTAVGMNPKLPAPASLCVVSNKTGDGGPLLQAYPNWRWYDETRDCNRKIISVYRVTIDKCNHMWVLDSGALHHPVNRVCPPKFLLFDLNTNKLIERVILPRRVYNNLKTGIGMPQTPVATIRGDLCDMGAIYFCDPYGYGLGIYRKFTPMGSTYRLSLAGFQYNPKHGIIPLVNETVSMENIGLYSLTAGSDRLFYCSMTSTDLYEAPEISMWLADEPNHPVKYTKYPNLLPSPICSMAAAEEHEVIFLGLVTETAIGVWNYRYKNKVEIIEQDPTAFQIISGMKVIRKKGEELKLMALSNRYQKFLSNTANSNEVNFRVITGQVEKLLHGTKAGSPSLCEKQNKEEKVKSVVGSEDARVSYNSEDL